MAKKYQSDPVAALILLTILASIIFYLFSIPEVSRQDILPPVSSYSTTWLQAGPGPIGSDIQVTKEKKIGFPPVTLDNTLKSDSDLLSNQVSVSRALYGAQPETLFFDFNSEKANPHLSFVVTSVRGNGLLTIKVNGQTIYSSTPAIGSLMDIVIPENSVIDGQNTLVISTSSPGFRFWQTNDYTLSSINIGYNKFSGDSSSVTNTFSLDQDIILDNVDLTMFVKAHESSNLNIDINSLSVFSGKPTTSLSIGVDKGILKSGTNSITFAVDKGGDLDLSFIQLVADTKSASEAENYFFSIGSKDWKRVQSGEFVCDMVIKKTSGASSIDVEINSFTNNYKFADDIVQDSICDKLVEGSNVLSLDSDEALNVAEITVGLRP